LDPYPVGTYRERNWGVFFMDDSSAFSSYAKVKRVALAKEPGTVIGFDSMGVASQFAPGKNQVRKLCRRFRNASARLDQDVSVSPHDQPLFTVENARSYRR
jgi:hypothetical protein